ncbi:MAG: hypothetical protein JJT89_07760 [Nitriliruptoraceae bacterium]|nr:hypothetical protein [Nitriliruptoraceae bacterium]
MSDADTPRDPTRSADGRPPAGWRARSSRRPPRRRAHTRWILVGSILGLALIVAGVWALEAVHPQVEGLDLAVDDVPALALDEVPSCTPATAPGVRDEVVRAFPERGRVSSEQVIACPRAYDGLEVTFTGEAIGEVLPRRGGAWLQVNDDAYALEVGPVIGHRELSGFNSGLAVWLPDGLHEQVEVVGRPAQRGDVLLLTGTIHRADADDGGGLTLRATELEVLAAGVHIEPPFHTLQAIVSGVLAVLALASLLWARRNRAR